MDVTSLGGMQQHMRGMFTERFSSADADKSGGLNMDEFQTMVESSKANPGMSSQEAFTKIDGDGDGILTEAELGGFVHSKIQSKIQSMMGAGGLMNILGNVGGSDSAATANLLEVLQNRESQHSNHKGLSAYTAASS